MAISIIEKNKTQIKPVYAEGGYNQLIFDTTNTGQTGYQMQLDLSIYDVNDISGLTTNLIGTFKYNLNLQGKVIFDPSTIIQNYLSSDFDINLIGLTYAQNTIKKIKIDIYDSWIINNVLTRTGSTNSIDQIYFNAVLNQEDIPFSNIFSIYPIVKNDSGFTGFLGDQIKYLNSNDIYNLYFLTKNYISNINIHIKYKGGAEYFYQDNSPIIFEPGTLPNNKYMYIFSAGPLQLSKYYDISNNLWLDETTNGSFDYYELSFKTSSIYGDNINTSTTKFTVINKEENCSLFENFNIYYLTKNSNFDKIDIDKKSYEKINISRQFWQQNNNYNYINSTRENWTQKSLQNTIQKSFSINTNWLSPTDNEIIYNLYQSNEVYLLKTEFIKYDNIINFIEDQDISPTTNYNMTILNHVIVSVNQGLISWIRRDDIFEDGKNYTIKIKLNSNYQMSGSVTIYIGTLQTFNIQNNLSEQIFNFTYFKNNENYIVIDYQPNTWLNNTQGVEYLKIEDAGNLITYKTPIIITDNEILKKTRINDNLVQYEINFIPTYKKITQRS